VSVLSRTKNRSNCHVADFGICNLESEAALALVTPLVPSSRVKGWYKRGGRASWGSFLDQFRKLNGEKGSSKVAESITVMHW
jgi:hypothetical protein